MQSGHFPGELADAGQRVGVRRVAAVENPRNDGLPHRKTSTDNRTQGTQA